MVRRRALAISTVLLGLVAASLGAWPFVASMLPSASAGNSLPNFSVRDLRVGEYEYFDGGFEMSRWRKEHILVIRRATHAFSVLFVTAADGKVVMPDTNSWGIGGFCSNFSLPFPSGKLPADGVLRCLDESQGDWHKARWQWDSEGRNIAKYFSDFPSPSFVVEDDFVVVGKWQR